ncbi:type VI secretion system tube protein Hcp, partial [Salmonella enterica]|nr:type VI secretion system tube protein Hcp [Salmonella enterica subsp. enterica serovar Reading]EKM7957111.1 type VI secretion system tube protein Hcp [Salmonella enterica]
VSGGAGGKPVETMSLNFTKIEWQITAEKSDGAQQESRTSVWDLAMDQIGK